LTKSFQESFVNCEITFFCSVFTCCLKTFTFAKLKASYVLLDYSIAKSTDINTGARKENVGVGDIQI